MALTCLALLAAGCFHDDDNETATDGGTEEVIEEMAMVDDGFHQVESGETLGGIVDRICGTNDTELLWHVVDVNSSNQQPDGNFLTHIDEIEVGWFLEIPCEVPKPPLIECPTSSTTAFLGADDRARVAICNTDGRTEYFGQRLSDRDSIILDACRNSAGVIQALNEADDGDFYYLVTPSGSPGLEIRRTAAGGSVESAEVIASYQFETIQASSGDYRSCSSAQPDPVEDASSYQLDLAPLTSVAFDTGKPLPEHTECNEITLGVTTQPYIWMPSYEADITKWIEIDQGNWLRLYIPDVSGTVLLEGGGLSWPMDFEGYDGSYQLQVTDEQPLGRYRITDSSGDPAAKVEVKRASWLKVVLDHEASSDRYFLYRIYGAPASADIALNVAQRLGCDGTRWQAHQTVAVVGRSNSGVVKLGFDLTAAPTDEDFCLAVDGTCHATINLSDG